MKIVNLFAYTTYLVEPWMKEGHTAILVDAQHEPGITISRDKPLITWGYTFEVEPYPVYEEAIEIFSEAFLDADLIVGFPPCTNLTVAGAARWKNKRAKDSLFQLKAYWTTQYVRRIGENVGCPWVLENPVGKLSTLWRKPDAYIQPYEYGGYLPEDDEHPEFPNIFPRRDAYTKKTGLWWGNGFTLPPKKPVAIELVNFVNKKVGGGNKKANYIRSLTPRGFSEALYQHYARKP